MQQTKTIELAALAIIVGVLIPIVVVSVSVFVSPLFEECSTNCTSTTDERLALSKTVDVNQNSRSFVRFSANEEVVYRIDIRNQANRTHDVILSNNITQTYSGSSSATIQRYAKSNVSRYNQTANLESGKYYIIIDNSAGSNASNPPFSSEIEIYTRVE